jgi:hypothetical protein
LAKSSSSLNIKNNGFAFACLALLILVVYSNTFHASWQFDDKPNIIDNYYLHLKDLKPQSLMNTFFTQPTNPWESGNQLYRPIACLTFALNWYFGLPRRQPGDPSSDCISAVFNHFEFMSDPESQG